AKTSDFLRAANDMGHSRADDLVSAVGYGKLSPANVLHKLYPQDKLKAAEKADGETNGATSALTQLFRRVAQRTRTSGGVRIGGVDDVLVRYGKCCAPVPGDPIIGFITRGRGVTVHVQGCRKATPTPPARPPPPPPP